MYDHVPSATTTLSHRPAPFAPATHCIIVQESPAFQR
jgi:hypothetical protein